MIIQKKRIHNISPHLSHIKDGSKIIVGIDDPKRLSSTLKNIGFTEPYEKGQTILPASVGPISNYNAEGKNIVHRDQPMETAYSQVDWKWQEWDGTWHSKIVDRSYKRYPRSFIEAPSVELTITESSAGKKLLTSPAFDKSEQNKEIITHIVNLFLEMFGEALFFTSDMDAILKIPVKRVNWEILPQGEMPWDKLKIHIEPIINQAPKGNRPIIEYRLETINKMSPDFIVLGHGGFHGYLIHAFSKKNLFVLESMLYGNATYVFEESWEELSKKTKAEILRESLQKARIIHREGWKKKVEEIIKGGD